MKDNFTIKITKSYICNKCREEFPNIRKFRNHVAYCNSCRGCDYEAKDDITEKICLNCYRGNRRTVNGKDA